MEQSRVGREHLIAGVLGVLVVMAVTLFWLGRSPICTCGDIKLWHGIVKSAENSQHLMDWYTPSHVVHGFLFYFALHLAMPKAPVAVKLLVALGLEAAWEVFENTSFIIDRYRTSTFAYDYYGDSILNSISDCLAMIAGFVLAARLPVRATVALGIAFELFTGWAIRDNLTLNILMLIYPIEWIKTWQEAGG